ncbi:uncharacterized protein LOC124806496 [Hydra vulgaris]|uniref:uncharacterized protein LOC105848245 n=1 Tax=Hydra vulgaris TaxID=6087 RepID=UPI0032EA7E9E
MNSTFPILFNSKLIFEDKNVIQLRASIKSEDEANQWVEEYGHKTHTRWLKSYKLNEPTRLVAHRKYQCQHSKLNKEIKSRKNTYCVAEIDIKIKKVNANTKKNDQYLKEEPPLSGVIVVHKNHNHNIECADSMKYLPVSSVTKKLFYNYFNSGLSPAQAKRIHTDKFIYHENGSFLLADASLNPSSRTIYYLYNLWQEKHFALKNPLEMLKNKRNVYLESGALVTVIEEDLKWSVLVVTEVMQRNQLRKSSSEIVFVDTTSSCDISQTNVTIVSTSSSAGCIPIAILFHANKTEENYEQAFKLLKLECPRCFGGSEEPQVFMLDDSSEEKNALSSVWPTATMLLCYFHVLQAQWRWLLKKAAKTDRQKLYYLFKNVFKLHIKIDL